jgi:sterol desaturase/sphingolipid hydroxylase (fatty acid hydroxylase superfamily)
MSHPEVSRSKEPIRLFQSDFLEFFTHVHPAVVLVIWLSVGGGLLAWAIINRPEGRSGGYIPVAFALGLFLWTLAEYLGHRFLFHHTPRNPREERIIFLLHGVHHAQPMIKTRLVLPPAASIPFAVVFYSLFYLLLVVILSIPHWLAPLFSGFLIGYLVYDMTHYAVHHFKLRLAYFQFIRSYHMRHHSQHPVSRFGVSSPLWDIVFGTKPTA